MGYWKSQIPEIAFPAIQHSRQATMLGLQFQLELSQWYSPERLLKLQLHQLEQLFSHAWKTCPFYKQRFLQAGYSGEQPIVPELIGKLPPLTREDLQNSLSEIASKALPKAHGNAKPFETSGSTGKPVASYTTAVTDLFWQAITLRDHLWHKRDLDNTLASIRSFGPGKALPPEGATSNGWGAATSIVHTNGRAWMLNSNSSIDVQLRWLVDRNPHYLISHPSNLVALAEAFVQRGDQLPHLKEVRTVGESVTPKVREACRTAWGCEVVDFYTSREVGYMALQCPEHDGHHYHVQSEVVYFEIVDEKGEPCEPGETGRVLATPLHNYAVPLIRYEIGDYATLGNRCDCGRGLPVLKQIQGRVRNMLHLPDGSVRWPHFGYRTFSEVAPISQYQVVQHNLDEIEMRLVVPESLSEGQESKLKNILQDNLGYQFQVTFSYHGKLKRGVSGKFEDFISHI